MKKSKLMKRNNIYVKYIDKNNEIKYESFDDIGTANKFIIDLHKTNCQVVKNGFYEYIEHEKYLEVKQHPLPEESATAIPSVDKPKRGATCPNNNCAGCFMWEAYREKEGTFNYRYDLIKACRKMKCEKLGRVL